MPLHTYVPSLSACVCALRACAREGLQRMIAHVIADEDDRGEQDKLPMIEKPSKMQ